MRLSLDLLVSGFLLIAAVVLFALTFGDQFDVPTFGGDVGPAFAPRGFLIVWMLLAGVAVHEALTGAKQTADIDAHTDGNGDTDRNSPAGIRFGQLFLALAVCVITGVMMTRIGFVFAAIPGFFLFCWAFGYRQYKMLLLISVAAPLLIWAVFTFGFELPLPNSPWFHSM